jgi:hypothetical protein
MYKYMFIYIIWVYTFKDIYIFICVNQCIYMYIFQYSSTQTTNIAEVVEKIKPSYILGGNVN